MFQFHKGAIRTIGDQVVYRAERKFQFHKGAIRTNGKSAKHQCYIRFNSIKVQLERSSGYSAQIGSRFQFHKGAIRTELRKGGAHPLRWFQFHKGAIRTSSVWFQVSFTSVSIP